MRILAVSDEVVGVLESPAVREHFGRVDIVLGCGDLPASYLEYLVTQLNVPLLYVPGNHDPDEFSVPGGQCIDGRVITCLTLRFAGLGGSPRYKSEGRHQYTEAEMDWRAGWLLPRLLPGRIGKGRGMDVLVTHSPPRGIHEGTDHVHRGFRALRSLARFARPRLMVHGHTHILGNLQARETLLDGTRIVNVFPYQLLELESA